jgi:hypothetical protein
VDFNNRLPPDDIGGDILRNANQVKVDMTSGNDGLVIRYTIAGAWSCKNLEDAQLLSDALNQFAIFALERGGEL